MIVLPLLLSCLTTPTAAASAGLQRHRILKKEHQDEMTLPPTEIEYRQQKDDHKETTGPPTITPDRLTPSGLGEDGNVCSCSPIKFTFRLALNQDCSNDDIAANAGIESTYCVVDDVELLDVEDLEPEPVRKLQLDVPVEITSVQYLEFESETFEVMYTDDSHLNVSLVDGDLLTFYSVSSYLPTVPVDEQADYVPGGVSLILTGKTEEGNAVRNRFYWYYDSNVMGCYDNLVIPGIYEGDAIGWVVTEAVSGPWPQFCPAASTTSPTIYPRTIPPTSVPTYSSEPSSEFPTTTMAPSGSSGTTSSSKASKDSSKSSKNDASKSSKNVYSGKSAKSSEFEFDSKSDKYSGYSSKSSKSNSYYYVWQFLGSGKSGKGSLFGASSKSSKSNDVNQSMSLSMSMPSAAPSEQIPSRFGSGKDEVDTKSGKAELDVKARKYSSKSQKGSSDSSGKASKGAVSASSKSGKSDVVDSDDISYSMSMPSTSPQSSPSASTMQYVSYAKSGKAEMDTKSSKAEADAKAEKYSSKSSGDGMKESSKSGKSEVVNSDHISYSMSMPSAAPSVSKGETVDTKAEKYTAKAYKIMKPKSGKGSVASSKSSKGSKAEEDFVESMSLSYSMPTTGPSISPPPTDPDYKVIIVKSGKALRSLMSEQEAAEDRIDSAKSGKADVSEETQSSKSSKSSYQSTNTEASSKAESSKSSKSSGQPTFEPSNMSYSSTYPSMTPSDSSSPSESAPPIHHYYDGSKSGKANYAVPNSSKSSKSSVDVTEMAGAKSAKESTEAISSKAGKSVSHAPPTQYFSMSSDLEFSAKSEKVGGDEEYSGKSSKSSAYEYRYTSGKADKGSGGSSKSGKSTSASTELYNSMSMPSAAPSESLSPSYESPRYEMYHVDSSAKSGKAEDVDSKAEKYSSKSSGDGYSAKSGKGTAASSKSGKSSSSSVAFSYSMSMPSAAPSDSISPTDENVGDAKAGKYNAKAYRIMKPKSGKANHRALTRDLMSEQSAEESRSQSSSGKVVIDATRGSKSSKGSIEASKSGKSVEYDAESLSLSMSMPSVAPSATHSPSSATHFMDSSTKSGKSEVDAKAEKYSSNSSGYQYASKEGETSSKSGKSASPTLSYSMSMPSSARAESFASTEKQTLNAKAEKYSGKAYKLMKPKSGKDSPVLSSKSNKDDKDVESIGSVSMSFSMSSAELDVQALDAKATKHSGKSHKQPIDLAKSGKSSDASSKSSKSQLDLENTTDGQSSWDNDSHDVGSISMSYSRPTISPTHSPTDPPSPSPTKLKYEISSSSKSSKSSQVEHEHYLEDSMSYSMSVQHSTSLRSGKSAKAGRSAEIHYIRGLKSERIAVNDVDCDEYECIDCRTVSKAPILDGNTADWELVEGFDFTLTDAVKQHQYLYGRLRLKCVHDAERLYFLFEIPGPYRFDPNDKHKSPAVSTMMQIGPDAEYYNHGNCPLVDNASCNEDLSGCTDYMVDIGGYWQTYTAEMGVKYGANQEAGDGSIADEYAYNPYCHFGSGDINGWEGAWSHTSPTEGNLGTYVFEMSRPLRTGSAFDAQLGNGDAVGFGFSYWHPYQYASGWTYEGHFVTGNSQDWTFLRLLDIPVETPSPTLLPSVTPSINPTVLPTESPSISPLASSTEQPSTSPTDTDATLNQVEITTEPSTLTLGTDAPITIPPSVGGTDIMDTWRPMIATSPSPTLAMEVITTLSPTSSSLIETSSPVVPTPSPMRLSLDTSSPSTKAPMTILPSVGGTDIIDTWRPMIATTPSPTIVTSPPTVQGLEVITTSSPANLSIETSNPTSTGDNSSAPSPNIGAFTIGPTDATESSATFIPTNIQYELDAKAGKVTEAKSGKWFDAKAGKQSSTKSLKIAPDDETAWAMYSLFGAVSKSGKSLPTQHLSATISETSGEEVKEELLADEPSSESDNSMSLQHSSESMSDVSPTASPAHAVSETTGEDRNEQLFTKVNNSSKSDKSSKGVKIDSSKSSKSAPAQRPHAPSSKPDEAVSITSYDYQYTSSKSSKSVSKNDIVSLVSKSSKNELSCSYSLSMQSSQSMPDKDGTSLKQNTFEVHEPPSIGVEMNSDSSKTTFEAEAQKANQFQFKSNVSSAFSSSQTTAFVLLLMNFLF